ncbi:hypothetical protein GOB83_04265 [Acetobacter fabarum]|nr:hypothetical protein [Acetobacter fabarum]
MSTHAAALACWLACSGALKWVWAAGTLSFAYAGHCLAGKSDEQEVNTRHRICVA